MKLTNKKYYKINFDKLLLLLLPTFMRKNRLAAFGTVLIAPVKEMYNEFRKQQVKGWYRLNHNGQVFSLRKVLNDHFDNEQRRIQIRDADKYERLYVYTPVEDKPLFLHDDEEATKYIYTKAECNNEFDFMVVLPGNIDYNLYKMRFLINEYKLATKKYVLKNEQV